MIRHILTLIIFAFITYLIEFPIIIIDFYKIIDFKYLNKIILLTNFFTNIILNGIIIPIESLYIVGLLNNLIIIIFEIFIIIIEYFLYKLAFSEFSTDKIFKRKLLLKTIIANISSFVLGILINYIF